MAAQPGSVLCFIACSVDAILTGIHVGFFQRILVPIYAVGDEGFRSSSSRGRIPETRAPDHAPRY